MRIPAIGMIAVAVAALDGYKRIADNEGAVRNAYYGLAVEVGDDDPNRTVGRYRLFFVVVGGRLTLYVP